MEFSPEIVIVSFVLIFGLIHSLLAREFIEEKLTTLINYDRFYNIVALLTLAFLVLIEIILAQYGKKIEVIIKNPNIGILLTLVGGLFFFGGMLQLNLSRGLHEHQLIKTGFFAFARHPIYLGGIVMLTSLGLFFLENTVHISFTLALMLYLFVGSMIEDYYLLRNVPDYRKYKSNCAKYLPWRKKHFVYLFRNINPLKTE